MTNKASITPLFIPHPKAVEDTSYFDEDRKFSIGRLSSLDPSESQDHDEVSTYSLNFQIYLQ